MARTAILHNSDLYYFSVQTEIAYFITVQYFSGRFFVHVAEEFDPLSNPGSSNPRELHKDLSRAAKSHDRGDVKIQSVQKTLRRVANQKWSLGEITDNQLREILDIIRLADPNDYRPLIYIIRRDKIINTRLKPVPTRKKPHIMSIEYTIGDLDKSEFAVLETDYL